MAVYLLPWAGTGTEPDPYVPRGIDQNATWSCIDLRPDSTAPTGFALVEHPTLASVPAGGRLVATALDGSVSAATRTVLVTRLGLSTLAATTVGALAAELLIDHARTDGTRWKPLGSRFDGANDVYEILLGGQPIYQQAVPRVRGGATFTENWNVSDSDSPSGQQTWTEVDTDWDVVSNQCKLVSGGGSARFLRCDSDFGSTDHYAQVLQVTSGEADQVTCRHSTSAKTCYAYRWYPASDLARIFKWVSGSPTFLVHDRGRVRRGRRYREPQNRRLHRGGRDRQRPPARRGGAPPLHGRERSR